VTPDDIVELFSVFGPVAVRRMFGGAGIYVDGTMFGLVAGGVIYLKAGDDNVAMFEREQLAPFTFSKRTGERVVTSYRRMPDRLYDDPEELAEWARAALTAARQRRERKKPVKKAKPSRAKSPPKERTPAKRASTKNSRAKKRRSR
jgi:DNA transformation protein